MIEAIFLLFLYSQVKHEVGKRKELKLKFKLNKKLCEKVNGILKRKKEGVEDVST